MTRGYMVDLMYLIGRRIGVQVHFYTPADGRWGSKNEDGEWTGLMGEVIKREVRADKERERERERDYTLLGHRTGSCPTIIDVNQ